MIDKKIVAMIMMLEPILVLTVLNCFFMFSSTVTTCALWWQYRKNRCYHRPANKEFFKDFSHSQTNRSKSHYNVPKKSFRSPIDKIISFIGTDNSNIAANKPGKHRDKNVLKHVHRSKRKESGRHHGVSKASSTKCIAALMKSIREEANQTDRSLSERDPRSKVIMEVATVQKVQIYDKNSNEPIESSIKNVSSYANLFDKKVCHNVVQKARAAKSSEIF